MDTSMFRKIDYALLAEQRKVLAELAESIVGSWDLTEEQTDALDGILNLTYCLAEWAVDHGIATEETAFPEKKEMEQ